MARSGRNLIFSDVKPRERPVDIAEVRKRNRAVLRSLLFSAIGVNIVLGLLVLYMVFLHMPYFNLRQVDVTGNHRLSREEVIEASGLEAGTNLLTVNLKGVADRLRRHPWISSATVYRRLPGRMIMEVEERTPRAILAADKLYYVDGQGDVFTRLLPGESLNYPLFSGVEAEQLKARAPELRDLLRKGLALLDLLDRKGTGLNRTEISEIRINLDQGLILHTNSGRTVLLGQGGFDVKLKRYAELKAFLARRGRWNSARTIDLDFEDRALVRSDTAGLQG